MRAHVAVLTSALLLPAAVLAGDCILVKNGKVVNAHETFWADVLIKGDLIEAVEPSIKVPRGCEVLDAKDKLVMPGGIDPHTHLGMDFPLEVGGAGDDYFTGESAALAGGTTMHIDFVLPMDGDIEHGLKSYEAKSKRGCSDYGHHVIVSKWNDKVSRDMGKAVEAGINSFKFFMAYKGALMVDDEFLVNALRRCKELGAVAMIHAENGELVELGRKAMADAGILGPVGHQLSRPPYVEGEATGRALAIARMVDTPVYIVHVMSKDALDHVVAAKVNGQRVIGEPVAAGLALEESVVLNEDFVEAAKFVMSPPIRSAEHRDALQAALAGGLLDVVGTDHAGFNSTQKLYGRNDFRIMPNGVNGIEDRMHVVWNEMVNSGRMSPSDFVRVTSTQCAKVFNIYPRKGVIARGSDADVIVLDPAAKHTISAKTHHSAIDINIFEGFQITGRVVATISRGRLVWIVRDGQGAGELRTTPGTARFVPTPPFGYLFDGEEARASQPHSYASRTVETSRDEL